MIRINDTDLRIKNNDPKIRDTDLRIKMCVNNKHQFYRFPATFLCKLDKTGRRTHPVYCKIKCAPEEEIAEISIKSSF